MLYLEEESNEKYYKLGGNNMSVKMLHTCIRVKNLEASFKFYQDALGLVETRRKDFSEHKFTLVYFPIERFSVPKELVPWFKTTYFQ